MLLSWLLAAALARAEVTAPVQDLKGAPVEPQPSTGQLWGQLYETVGRFKSKNTGFGPVAIYNIHSDAKLPSRIFIARSPSFKGVVIGFLNGMYGNDWKKTKGYWVLDKDQAVRSIAKAMKLKQPEEIKHIKDRIEAELGPSLFMIYRVEGEEETVEDAEDDAPGPPLESADLSTATAPLAPR